MNIKKALLGNGTVRTLLVSILVIVFFVGIVIMYYNMVYFRERDNIILKGELSSVKAAEQFDNYLSTNVDSIKLSAYTLDGMIAEKRSDSEIQDYLVGQSTAIRSAVLENMTGLYGYINGRFFSGTNWEPPADYDAKARPWYTNALEKKGEIAILEPYVDVQTGNTMLAIGKTLCDGVSVISVDVSLDQIQQITEDAVTSGLADFEMILNDHGVVVAHSDKSEIGNDYTSETGTLGAMIMENVRAVENNYFEFVLGDSHYIAYYADMQNGWRCISVKNASSVFGSLSLILVLTVVVAAAIVLVVTGIMGSSARHSRMTEQISKQLSSTAEIYISMHEINFVTDTFTEVQNNKAEAARIIGETRNNCQQMIRAIMTRFSDESTRESILDFVDFSKLDSRLKDRSTITSEFLSADKKWRRARYIVSGRLADGRVSTAMYLIEDIDAEKRERDTVMDAVKMMNEQVSSVANIYFTMYDIDLENDRFREVKTHAANIADLNTDYMDNAQSSALAIVDRITSRSTRQAMREFIDFSTLDDRLLETNTITQEFLNNDEIWCRARFVVSRCSDDGAIEHVLWLVESIDEEKRKRDEISEAARNLNTQMASISNIYMTVFDIDLVEDSFSVIKSENSIVNSHIRDQRGDAQKLMIASMRQMTDESSMDDVMSFINFATLDRRLRDTESIALEMLTSTHKWVRVRFMVSQRGRAGKVTHVLWLAEDINSEKAEREKLIDMSERALAASEAKSSFLSNMSHEIRTPINAVLGMNEMILRECDDRNILTYAESIRTAGSTLLGLVNDILDFSKIEAGKMEIIPVDYDLSSVINDLVNMIQTKADDKGLKLDLEISETVPKQLHGDEVRIKQVITNILTNAVKYTETGTVTFGIRYETIPEEPDHIMLRVMVKDTGIGIRKEDMRKLFSEFDRIDEERNRNVEGTGLGMSITKRLLEMMDSSLVAESIYGLGSKFSFELKQRVVKWEELGDYAAAYKASLGKRRKYHEKFRAPTAEVLVVDDTPMNLVVFRSLLKQTAVKIDTANSGAEGVSLAYDKKYDIIFLDHMMPEKDGIETLHEIRSQEKNPNLSTPTICLTANAISGAREQYLAAGFDDYLTKPIDSAKLEAMLAEYLPAEKVLKYDDDDGAAEPENAPASGLPPFIEEIPEIDTTAGIKNCGGEEAYMETLKTYAGMIGDHADETERYWQAGDIGNATIKIHAMKSTSRIIGAADIGELAQELETAGKQGDTGKLGEKIDELLSRCRDLGERLRPLIGETPEEDDGDKPPISAEELKEAYGLIKEALDAFQFDNINEIVGSFRDYSIPEPEKERVKNMISAVENLDYDRLPEIMK
ncbi:MAG: response regulator [Ruminiclostridium sp.]|nr:response regulator [Ruminiclostridium sp.]